MSLFNANIAPMTDMLSTYDNSDIDYTIVEDCNECIDYMLDLVSLSLNNDKTRDDVNYESKRSQHCIVDESDDEFVSEVKDLVDYMLELVSTAVPQSGPKPLAINGLAVNRSEDIDDDIEIIEIERSDEDKTYEVIDLTDSQLDENLDYCLVCGQNKEIKYQVKHNDKTRSCCSWDCVQTLQSNNCCSNCSAFISEEMQGFRPNFGGNAILCSEDCLQRSEVEKQPNTHCFTCRTPLIKDKVIYYWQTMEFCSAACVQTRQLIFGAKCAQCNTTVNRQSLGKYSVRFGDVIKQFCVGTCLEAFKKSLKVCAFCQKDLKFCVSICIATFGFGDKMRLREFCDTICKAQYALMLSARTGAQIQCSQCYRNCETKTVIDFVHQNQKYLMCSSVCVAAFKYANKLKAIFCENCHKYGWANRSSKASLHILHYSGMTRIFCTKKCMSMYVLKNRRIVACLCCKVKKYNFDLIERFDWPQNDSRLFCSLNCLSLFDVSEEEKSKLSSQPSARMACNQCNQLSIPQFFLRVDNTVRSFCNYQCVFQHQRQHLPESLIAVENHMNGSVGNAFSALQSNTPLQQSHMWTPSFFGQQKEQTSQEVSLDQLRPNILTTRRAFQAIPLSTVNKTISSVSPSITTVSESVSQSIDTEPNDTSGATTGTQTIVKEIVKETKEVIVKVPASKVVKNKCTQFRPPSQTKGTSCRPFQMDQEVQTDPPLKIICPILLPIPIFVPIPVSYMQPLAVPLPLPVPFFLKPDPPTPPKPDPPVVAEVQNDSLNLTEQQLGEMEELLSQNNGSSQPSTSKRRISSEGKASKRGRRQADINQTGRGRRGRGRGGRGGGRGRGRGRGRKREEWEMSSSEEEEEEASLDNDTEEEEQQNESSNNSEDLYQPQQPILYDLSANPFNTFQTIDTSQLETVVSTPRGRGRGRPKVDTQPIMATNFNAFNTEEPKKPKRGRKKKESEVLESNSGIESELSTNTANAGINALRIWLRQSQNYYQTRNVLELHQNYLSEIFCKFVEEICQVHGQQYSPDYIYMLCLDLQKHLAQNNRLDNIFMDPSYKQFIHAIHTRLLECNAHLSCIQEEMLWECGQLGAHSPTVLLNTVMYLSTKYFHMCALEDHTQFSFSNLNKEWANDSTQCLIYQSTPKRGRKRKTLTLYENQENPMRCPVKLFEFYLSKCPDNVIQRKDMFYLYPIEGCVPDSQTWYSSNPLTNASVAKMLQRILVVREIVALSATLNL